MLIRISPIFKSELSVFGQNDGGCAKNRKKILLPSLKTSIWT